jgi:hypothetical protein
MTYCCNQNTHNTSCCDTTISGNMVVNLPVASMIPVTTSFGGSIYTTALPTMLSTSITTSPTAGAATPTAGAASPTAITASSTPSSTSHHISSLSAGTAIGIGIAATLGFFLTLLVLACVFLKRRHGKGRMCDLVTKSRHKDIRSDEKLQQHFVAELHSTDRHEMQ